MELEQSTYVKPNGNVEAFELGDNSIQPLRELLKEQEKAPKKLEAKVKFMQDLLNQKLDKNGLLERNLTDNHKQISILNKGSENLDKKFSH